MRKNAFSLVEMMVSLTILASLALALGLGIITARQMSESAVYQGLALSVATGYLEQIKVLDYAALEAACADPNDNPLQTMQDNNTADPLTAGMENTKYVTLDVDEDGDATVKMKMKITPLLTNLNSGTNPLRAIDIKILYDWKVPGCRIRQERALRAVRSFTPSY